MLVIVVLKIIPGYMNAFSSTSLISDFVNCDFMELSYVNS